VGFQIRPYAAADEAQLLAVWNEAMWADPIEVNAWRSRYLLDANFEAGSCPVAVDVASGDVVGFVLGFSETQGTQVSGTTPREAWVVGFGVRAGWRRKGVGAALMRSLEARWRAAGVTRVQYGPYVPGYVTPGVDVNAYPDAVRFLDAIGARELYRPLSMKVSLTGYRAQPDVMALETTLASAGVTVRPAGAADIGPLLTFLDEHFPHWRTDATSVLRDLFAADPRGVAMFVAEENGAIIGYAQARGERFGPFGVDEGYRGRGVGGVLLAKTLLAMRANGFHCAWFLWTSDRAAKLYRQHGFEEVRRFSLMAKPLDQQIERREERGV
jgi:mycothiol synthase